MDFLVQIMNSTAALIVIWGSMCALNGMCRSSSMVLRVAHICLAVGSAAVLLAPYYLHREPTPAELLMVYGAAVLSFRLTFRRPIQRTSREIRHFFRQPKD